MLNMTEIISKQELQRFGDAVCKQTTKNLADRGYIGNVTLNGIYIEGDTAKSARIFAFFGIDGEYITSWDYPLDGHTDIFGTLVNSMADFTTSRIVGLIEYKYVPYCKVWQADYNGKIRCIDVGDVVSKLIGQDVFWNRVEDDIEENGFSFSKSDADELELNLKRVENNLKGVFQLFSHQIKNNIEALLDKSGLVYEVSVKSYLETAYHTQNCLMVSVMDKDNTFVIWETQYPLVYPISDIRDLPEPYSFAQLAVNAIKHNIERNHSGYIVKWNADSDGNVVTELID